MERYIQHLMFLDDTPKRFERAVTRAYWNLKGQPPLTPIKLWTRTRWRAVRLYLRYRFPSAGF